MRAFLCLAVLATLCLACAAKKHDKHHSPPVWPAQYKVSFNLTVPYIDTYQKGRFTYVYDVWQDIKEIRQKVVRNGVETVLSIGSEDKRYNIYPHRDRWGCWSSSLDGGGAGPTLQDAEVDSVPLKGAAQSTLRALGQEQGAKLVHGERERLIKALTFVLPDLAESRWAYRGKARLAGAEADLYVWAMHEESMAMEYRMYVDPATSAPLQLHQLGTNLLTGGHKDEYVLDYYDYAPGAVADADFNLPADSHCDTPDFAVAPNGGDLAARWAAHLPSQHWGEPAYDAFAHRHGRRHAHAEEYAARAAEFSANRAFVARWNADPNRTHDVALNRFADWSRAEYEAVVLPRAAAGAAPRTLFSQAPGVARHVPTTPAHMVPASLSWVGTPADSPVKDQAACGSCWTFSTVAPFEAALFRETGVQTLLSEQNLLDCNWMETNHGCFGGQQVAAMDWIFANGGLAAQADYPYVGVNDWCKKDVPKKAFTGKAVLVEGGEEALKEALYTQGPLTVSVDASADSFRFYSGGVYRNEDCKTKAADLDHAVILSGYGTTEEGVDYWLIKNMWSTYWGEQGYMKIPRHPNDCGIAAEPVYVDLKVEG
ncbi:hypothetical protein ACKKBG_A20235 [Auxenochlorella protothecoides x Auxenochlorella symbiontica]